MSRTYFLCRFRLDGSGDRYLIWYSNVVGEDADGVFVDARGEIPVFRTPEDLFVYAEANRLLALSRETSGIFRLNRVQKWLKRRQERPLSLDCAMFLNAWNLLADVSRGIGGDFDSDKRRTQKIYEKLFWGNNLRSMTPPGKEYEPVWSSREQRIIREVLGQGLIAFRRCIHLQRV